MYVPVTRSSILNAVLHYLTLVSYSALFALSRSTDNVPASCDPARDSEIIIIDSMCASITVPSARPIESVIHFLADSI